MRTLIKHASFAALSLILTLTVPSVAQSLDQADVQTHGYGIQTFPFNPSDGATAINSGKAPSTDAAPAIIVAPVPLISLHEPELAANPGRPSMATSALLTPVGYVQFENGVLYAAGSAEFANRAAMEETMRLTVAPRLQFIFSAEPIAYTHTAGNDVTQRGDATAGLQVLAMEGRGVKPTLSFSYLRLLNGGTASDLDIGGYTNSAVLLASLDMGRFHFDSNGFINEAAGAVRRAQFGEATAATLPLLPRLSATLELRYFTEPLTSGHAVSTLLAGAYSPRPNLCFDAGVARGLNPMSTRWQVTGGFTYMVPHRTWGF